MQGYVLRADWDPRPRYRATPHEIASRHARVSSEVWRHPRYEAADLPEPEPGHGEIVVAPMACGICGSDTHCYETDADGYVKFSGPARLPCVGGHEVAGRVVAVGAGARRARLGSLVALEGMLYCGVCEACRRGRPNQCSDLAMLGFSAHGAFAERLVVHERHAWEIDDLADALGSDVRAAEFGALVEPIACAYNAIWGSGCGMSPGAHVAVHGAGPIGLGAVLLARVAGAASITVFEPIPERRALALACGADAGFDPGALARAGTSASEQIRERTAGWGADLQVEAAGAALETLPEIERSLAPGGAILYLGRTGERAPVELDRLVSGGARIFGSRGHAGGGCFPALLRLLTRGRLDPSPLVTARHPRAGLIVALEQSRTRRDGKILIS